ncbi:ABC transporter ATP-binding protein [Rhizobium sp.]
MNPVITIQNLCVDAMDEEGKLHPVLRDINLHIAPGEVVAAIGASGSGKSTLGLAMAGYVRPGARIISGTVEYEGRDLLRLHPKDLRQIRGREISFVPQSAAASFNSALRIEPQVVERVPRTLLAKRSPGSLSERLFESLGLPDPKNFGRRFPHQVSGGQLQRAAAAMAFAPGPKVVVFDEPTTALDVTTQVGVLGAFRDHIRRSQVAALYISHDLAVVAQLADRVIVLDGGRIIDEGPVDRILSARRHPATKRSETDLPRHRDETLIAARGLSVIYPGQLKPALSNVSFEVGTGEIVGLIGESGSGKSTIARVVAGLSSPSSGQLLYKGQDLPGVRHRSVSTRRQIQIAFQSSDVALNPNHTVRDTLARPISLFQGLRGAELDAEIRTMLDSVGLSGSIVSRLPGQLSGGQKQRLNLARALAAKPELLICDEVTSALDTPLRDSIIQLLERARRERALSILFITHDLLTVAEFADRIVVLRHGEVVEHGPAADTLREPAHPYTKRLQDSIPQTDRSWLDAAIARHGNAP